MKSLAVFVLLMSVALPGCNGAPELPVERIRAECHMVIVSQADALTLVPELQDNGKTDAAWGRLEAMLRQGQAVLAGYLVGHGALGTSVSQRSVEQVRYATEFEPPQLPPDLTKTPAELLKIWPHVGITATSFETRDVGQMLTLEVKQEQEGGPLWINAAPEHVRFLRWAKWDCGRFANGERISIDQPLFHTMKTETRFPFESGKRVLLGVHKVPEAEKPAFELFLLRVILEKGRK